MLLSSCCLIYCPTPKGKQGQFALKAPAVSSKSAKTNRPWIGRQASRNGLKQAYAVTAGN